MNALRDNEIQVGDRLLTQDDLMLAFQVLRPAAARDFMIVLRLMLPHEQADLQFARLMTALVIDSQLVANLGLRALIAEGLRSLDSSCLLAHRATFGEATEEQQIDVLRLSEDTPFFQTLLHIAKSDFYNRHIVWRTLGYPDLDHEAGYLDDGFDRLDV